MTMGDTADYHLDRLFVDIDDMYPEDPLDIVYIEILKETKLAWLIRFDNSFPDPKQEWIPKSETYINEKEKKVFMPTWLATEKELV